MFKFITDFFDKLWMKQYTIYVRETHNRIGEGGLIESHSNVEIYDNHLPSRPRNDISILIEHDIASKPGLFQVMLGAYGKKQAKRIALEEVKNYKRLRGIRAEDLVNERYGVPVPPELRPPRGGSGVPSFNFVNTAHSTIEASPRAPGDILQVLGENPGLFISANGVTWNQVRSQNGTDPTTIKELKEKCAEQPPDFSRKLVVFKNDTV